MLNEFEGHLNNDLAYLKDTRSLLAISGGIDSVVLAHLCHELKLDIALAHCNFNLRGEESDADEQFVIDLSDALDLEVFVENFETESYAKQNGLSIQMAARELRYNWFEELSGQLKFDYILTAHHSDDNLETFLINLSRGTGLDGLIGIPLKNKKIVRPLLFFSRATIEKYAKDHKLKWREDTSNESDKYLRNALRIHVIPTLKELNPQLLPNFENTISNLKDAKSIIKDRIKKVRKKVIIKKAKSEIHYSVKKLKKLSNPKAYLYHLLNEYGFTEWNDVNDLLDAQSGKKVLSPTHRLVKHRKVLILSKVSINTSTLIPISHGQEKVKIDAKGVLLFDEADALFSKANIPEKEKNGQTNFIHVDKDLLKFPLTVRGWQEGDYFYPLGMKGRKKLSKFFKDEKLSLLDKENSLLLCSDNNIVWVIDQRLDDRYKVTDKTENVLKITFGE
ncbi:MAG: tRNA lysidine(34) synthetase TilS [Flavobacteriaceae bacterium]|nr:MAG: tRNA lysidine(34) synthetase TilS [Flavobacteriaceae bacterium]